MASKSEAIFYADLKMNFKSRCFESVVYIGKVQLTFIPPVGRAKN